MAKNAFPMQTGSSVLSKIVKTLIVILLIVLMVKYPSDAARWVTAALKLLSSAVEGIVTFLRQVQG